MLAYLGRRKAIRGRQMWRNERPSQATSFRFARAERDALFEAVLIHDAIHLDATMPRHFPVPSAERLERAFWLSHEMWRDGFSNHRLAGIAATVARSGCLATSDLEAVKHVRARCKQLRFLFVLADARHAVPRHLDRLTRAMGTMQDAAKHGRAVKAARTALWLRVLLSRPMRARLARESIDFDAVREKSFAALIDRQAAGLREILGRVEIGIREFHEGRKIVSSLVALYDAERIIAPSPQSDQVGFFLNTLNGLMGGLHDDLVARKMVSRAAYRSGTVVIPPAIASRLRDLTTAMASRLNSA